MNQFPSAFWCVSATEILQHLGTGKEGLSREAARQRLARYGSNLLQPQNRSNVLTLLLVQFRSPLILIPFVCHWVLIFLTDKGENDESVNRIMELVVGIFAYQRLWCATGQGSRVNRWRAR